MLLLLASCWSPSLDDDDDDDDNPDWFDSGDADADTDADGDSDSDSDADCDAIVESTVPRDGTTDVYHRSAVEFELSEPDDDAEITASFDGELSWRGNTAVYTPLEPLDLDSQYSATLDYCGGIETIEFRTSDIGEPMEDADDLVGHTFALNLGDARFVEPPGIGTLLKEYLTVDYLLGITEVGRGSIDMIMALGREESDPPEQDFCNVTLAAPTADFADAPYFETEAQTVEMNVSGYTVEIYDMQFGGTFAADGESIGGIVFVGTMDTRALYPLIDADGDEGTMCELVPSFGVECEECPDGEPYCLRLHLDNATADEVRGLTLLDIDDAGCEGCDWWGPDDVPDLDDVECSGESGGTACAVVSGMSFGAIGLSLLALRRRPRAA